MCVYVCVRGGGGRWATEPPVTLGVGFVVCGYRMKERDGLLEEVTLLTSDNKVRVYSRRRLREVGRG